MSQAHLLQVTMLYTAYRFIALFVSVYSGIICSFVPTIHLLLALRMCRVIVQSNFGGLMQPLELIQIASSIRVCMCPVRCASNHNATLLAQCLAMTSQSPITLPADILTLVLHNDSVLSTGSSPAWGGVQIEQYNRDMAQVRALINRPSVISDSTLQELGGLGNRQPQVQIVAASSCFGQGEPSLGSSRQFQCPAVRT